MMKTTVLLADDHDIVRAGIRHVLNQDPTIQLVHESKTGDDAVANTLNLKPDIAILDINMPKLDGLQASEKILDNNTKTKILILSMYDDKRFIEKALRIGVSGYLLKESAEKEVTIAIKNIAQNINYLSPAITHIVMQSMSGATTSSVDQLTEREQEVLKLLAEGLMTKERFIRKLGQRLHKKRGQA